MIRTIKNKNTPIGLRLEYLNICDFNYLSTRMLYFSMLSFPCLNLAATTIELSLKQLLALIKFHKDGIEMTFKEFRDINHNLIKLKEEILSYHPEISICNIEDKFLIELQEAYNMRYPDLWPDSFVLKFKIDYFDYCYFNIRDYLVFGAGTKDCEDNAKKFGIQFFKIYSDKHIEFITNNNPKNPIDILFLENCYIKKASLDFDYLQSLHDKFEKK